MKLFIHFLLISSLSIMLIAADLKIHLSNSYIEGTIAKGDQSLRTDLPPQLKLLKGGEIYRSEHTLIWKGTYNDNTDVAIKIFNRKHSFEAEKDAFEKLNATNVDFDIEKHRIPRVYVYGPIFDDYDAIAMTWLGETLKKRFELQEQEFSDPTILLIFKQCVETLEYIHSKNVKLNAFAAENIFIRGQDVFLGDFDFTHLTGFRVFDYVTLQEMIWRMVVPEDDLKYPDAVKLEYFTERIVRRAFRSILKFDYISGKGGLQPNYEEIIKKADKALTKIGKKSGKPVQFDWLEGDSSDESSTKISCSVMGALGCRFENLVHLPAVRKNSK